MIKTFIKKYSLLFFSLVLIIVVANVMKSASSKTLTRYRKTVDGTDTARVAKWSITSKSVANGEDIELDSGFRCEVLEGTGNWAFQISNDSMVTASVDLGSQIRIRLDNDSYGRHSDDEIDWNFLSDTNGKINNPISFKVTRYKENIENLLKYQHNETSAIISYDEFTNLSSSEKTNYTQIIASNVASEKTSLLIDLSDMSDITFKKESEQLNNKLVFYYYYDFKFSDVVNSVINSDSDFLTLNMSDEKALTFVIDWNISSSAGSGNVEDNTTYHGYKLAESSSIPSGYEKYETISINDKEYAVCRTSPKNFYEYMKYVSSLTGGEPWFNFTDDTLSTKRVKYSDLTTSQIEAINSYPDALSSITSLDELQKYVEKLEYNEYSKFYKDSEEQQASLGYLSYGLQVKIQFSILVKQVKPE